MSEDGHNALHSDQDEIESKSSENEDNDDGRESEDHSFNDAHAEMFENMNEASLKCNYKNNSTLSNDVLLTQLNQLDAEEDAITQMDYSNSRLQRSKA